jgi:hypothetical protein
VQLEAFWVVEKLLLQAVHTRSLVLVPALCTYVPAAHVDQVVHELWFCEELYLLAAQGAQVRSVVVLPADCTYCPAAHVVLGTHGVAGSMSSSQLEAEQAASPACPPAQ